MVAHESQLRPWWSRRWPLVALLLLLVVALALVVLWVFAPALYKGGGALPDAQATATATTRTGILAVFAATIAALGAAAALAETRHANRKTHERFREEQNAANARFREEQDAERTRNVALFLLLRTSFSQRPSTPAIPVRTPRVTNPTCAPWITAD